MTPSPNSSPRPNFVVILADDMGFSDIGCYGSEIRTPNLDRLAQEGVRFTHMYNCARCCPTRASLLTGLYPHQAGVGAMIADCGVGPSYQGYLREDVVTLGEALKPAGYRTFWSGKWHTSPGLTLVGKPVAPLGSAKNPWPLSRGFDRFYGTPMGAGNYFNPVFLLDQERRVEVGMDFYYTDGISEAACRMVDEAARDRAPFLLHVCYTAPHWPLHALPEDIARYRGTYRKGWDALRQTRFESLRATGLIHPRWRLSPRDPKSRDFAADSPARQDWEDARMAVYAAQVDRMDQGIGRILERLREQGLDQNTLVMFLSDNGGCAEFLNEDGDPNRWPGHFAHTARPGETCRVGNLEGIMPGPATTFMSYDLPWANASNTPFRMYKHWVHEGGIATPLVCRWPARVAPGGLCRRPSHVLDIMATCLDAAGAAYPSEFQGRPVQPLEGESFLPALCGRGPDVRDRPLFWEHEGNRAMLDPAGQWKLVSRTVESSNGPWELYDLETDRTELDDRAGREPGRVRNMAAAYTDWAARCGVLALRDGRLIQET
jgi:arylsulfatase